jgi:hypothetical protein
MVEDFDAQACIDDYGEAVASGDDSAIKRLREAWKAWTGEDSLHETAFGEPEE